MTASSHRVLQMRLVVEADDYEEAVRFYRDVLGAAEELQVHGDGGERVTILDVGRATLEISSPEQVEMIDRVEVGRRVAPKLRVAFEVADAQDVTDHLVQAGADVVAPPTRNPVGVTQLPSGCSRRPPDHRVRGTHERRNEQRLTCLGKLRWQLLRLSAHRRLLSRRPRVPRGCCSSLPVTPGHRHAGMTAERRLLAVVGLVSKLGQDVGRIAIARIGKATQLRRVTQLVGQLDKLINSVGATAIREATQLRHVTPLARQLDELVHGFSVPACGTGS
jgi:predicted enzyme related to lactoylglutathione lyase